jgi:hypothetical protein
MDFVSTKRTFFILIATLVVAVALPASVYLYKSGSFDIRNQAGEETEDTTETSDNVETEAVFGENVVAQWNFNEDGDAELPDITTNENDGTLSGFDETDSQDQNEYSGWTDASASFDGALMFDGVDDYVTVENDASLRPEEITISVWFRTEESGFLISKYRRSTTRGFAMKVNSDVLSCFIGGDEWLEGEVEVTDGQWHNGVCTYDGTSVKIYVDGEQDGSSVQDGNVSSSDGLTIGAYDLGSSGYFEGIMDCVQIYDVALSATNISSQYDEEDFENAQVQIEQDSEDDEELSADLDEDGNMDVDDYYIFTSDLDSYKNGGAIKSRSDFDQDGDIDMDDYVLFSDMYGSQ